MPSGPQGAPTQFLLLTPNSPVRPEIVETRDRIGDWEGDTIIGKGRAHVTLVKRNVLYAVIMRLSGKHAGPLAQTVIKVMKPRAVRIDIISLDNDLEFAEYARIAQELNAAIYFAHPYAP